MATKTAGKPRRETERAAARVTVADASRVFDRGGGQPA